MNAKAKILNFFRYTSQGRMERGGIAPFINNLCRVKR